MYSPTCFRPPLGSIQVHVKTADYKLIFKIFEVTTQQNIQAIGRNIKATKCSNGKLDGPSSQLEPLQGNRVSYFIFAVPPFNYSHNRA
jgi:hypothetical protein